MFQRLKGAIDSRIAEEQARQRGLQNSPSRSSSATRRASTRAGSPGRPPARSRDKKDAPASKGPDPADFEPEFVIGEDEAGSGTATPRQEAVTSTQDNKAEAGPEDKPLPEAPKDASTELDSHRLADGLPTEVRVKLRKLDRLESKYQELLKAYRIAHARVQLIEPFEATLRENTPLASISEPGALIEYLNQLNLKGDMVVDELKRVTAARDDYKNKLEDAEKSTREAWDEVANLKKYAQSETKEPRTSKEQSNSLRPSLDITNPSNGGDGPDASVKSPTPSTSSRVASFSLFSPRSKPAMSPPAVKSPPAKAESEEFFSYDNEVPRLEEELKERQTEVDNLKHQVQTLKGDLSVARESTEGMVQSLESATRELNGLRDAKDQHISERGSLEKQIEDLKSKLTSTENYVETSSSAIEELKAQLRQREIAVEELNTNVQGLEKDQKRLELQVEEQKARIHSLELEKEKSSAELLRTTAELSRVQDSASKIQADPSSEKRMETMQGVMKNLKDQLKEGDATIQDLKQQLQDTEAAATTAGELWVSQAMYNYLDSELHRDVDWTKVREKPEEAAKFVLSFQPTEAKVPAEPEPADEDASTAALRDGSVPGQGKKKNKKKKKGKGTANGTDVIHGDAPRTDSGISRQQDPEHANAIVNQEAPQESQKARAEIEDLQERLSALQSQVEEKDTAIERLHAKLKGEEELKEEIESLRDDLLNVGQEHVEAKDKLKAALAEKSALEETIQGLEKELVDLRASHASGTADSEKAHQELLKEYQDLKAKVTTLQTSLNAAEQLAASRFKELTDLRDILQKAQPELKTLRTEVAELKSAKDDLKNKAGELRRLEERHEDLKSEMKGLSNRIGVQDAENKSIQQKLNQETSARMKAEEARGVAESDLRFAESRKQEAMEATLQVSKDLQSSREEARSLQAKVRELEDQIESLTRSTDSLKEELELKTAQYASAQSLMNSMRDQTSELGTQMKEARDRCENLEEELSESQRMLSERTREGETMRRLLADVETRADIKVREMKERMESAVEERDRAEDEAATAGRRRAREVEDLKTRIRDAERALKRAEDDKEELEHVQKDWRRRREELESAAERAAGELQEVRAAMTELRDALDESERQIRDLEKEKAGLRQAADEVQQRFDKLQKANKSLSEEMRSFHAARKTTRPGLDSGVQSSRSSIDSSTPPQRVGSVVGSPAPRDRDRIPSRAETPTGPNASGVDYVYLKNVLLQFLEQRDKNHQKQLIPVLGMLLHFDRKDEQKWMSAISSR